MNIWSSSAVWFGLSFLQAWSSSTRSYAMARTLRPAVNLMVWFFNNFLTFGGNPGNHFRYSATAQKDVIRTATECAWILLGCFLNSQNLATFQAHLLSRPPPAPQSVPRLGSSTRGTHVVAVLFTALASTGMSVAQGCLVSLTTTPL